MSDLDNKTTTTTTTTTTATTNTALDTTDFNPFLLHKCVVKNDIEGLKLLLKQPIYKTYIDIRDNNGYPASHYAAHLGYKEILEVLLNNGANPNKKSAAGWSIIQEACGRKDREIVGLLLNSIKTRLEGEFKSRLPSLVSGLSSLPDFEMEMKWEIKSWVPLVSRFCPYDTYKIYKRGSSFRVDTTIVGVNGIKFQRGDLVFMFTSNRFFSVDNMKKTYVEFSLVSKNATTQDEEISIMLHNNIKRIKILTDKIEFTPSKSWFGYEKTEKIGDEWNAKVYEVQGVDLKILSRKNKKDQIQGRVGVNSNNKDKTTGEEEQEEDSDEEIIESAGDEELSVDEEDQIDDSNNNNNIKSSSSSSSSKNNNIKEQLKKRIEEAKVANYQIRESSIKSMLEDPDYFKLPKNFDLENHEKNIDKAKLKTKGLLCDGESVSEKHKYFKGTMWISEEFPRKVSDLLPIFEALSPTNKLFSRLSEFISLKLPSQGFPVKLDFPVFPTITATVIFTKYTEKEIKSELFNIPKDYVRKQSMRSK